MQHKILLLDELGDKWGKTHTYHNLRSPKDALKLLYINHPDLCKYFATAHENGIGFTVVQAGQFLDYSDLALPLGKNDLVITPVITGSGSVGKALVGVALIVATGGIGTALGVTGAGASGLFGVTTGVAGVIGGVLGKIGVALVLSGVSDMLSPQPQLPNFEFDFNAPLSGFTGGAGSITRGSDGSQSYAYTGAANTVGVGKTIPVVYGQALIGGHILSTDIDIANESDPLMKFIRPPSLDSVRLNGEQLTGKYETVGGLEARIFNGSKHTIKGTTNLSFNTFTVNLQTDGEQRFLANLDANNDGGNNDVDDFQLLFRVQGLVDFVGNNKTTRIDGFITYRIIVKEKESGNIVLNNQATIQGLTVKTQSYNYLTKLPFQFITGKNIYHVFVQIIDTGVDFNNASFKILQAGFNLKN